MTLGSKSQTAIYTCIMRHLNFEPAKQEELVSESFVGWQNLQSNGAIRKCQLGAKPFALHIILYN